MSCVNQDFTKLNFVDSLNETFYINTVEENLKSFFDYGLLNVGGFINVTIPTSGLYSNNFHKLSPISDPANKANTIWATPKQEWVWETGVVYNGQSPINISGLYINNTFYPAPTGSGSVSYKLDYSNGQVVFDKALSATANVTMNYSYKWCKVMKASDPDAQKILQKLSFRNLNSYNETNHNSQLPCIIFETTPRDVSKPYELGSLTTIRRQDILANIYTESDAQRKMLIDIFKLQSDKMIKLYDTKIVASSGYYGLNKNGSINPSGLDYSQIVCNDNLVWNKAFFQNVSYVDSQQNVSSTLFWCIVRITTEIIY